MDEAYTKVRRTLSANLRKLIYDAGSTINAEAISRHIPQRTLQHLADLDRDPQLGTIAMVAEAFGLQPWMLLIDPIEAAKRGIELPAKLRR